MKYPTAYRAVRRVFDPILQVEICRAIVEVMDRPHPNLDEFEGEIQGGDEP